MSKKILPLLVGTLSLLPLIVRANDIEPGKEFYTATRASPTNPIVVDGVLNEWIGVPVLADPKFYIRTGFEGSMQGKGSGGTNATLVLFERYQGGDWTGPDDHTSAVQIVYDADNVYFGFVVTDEYHENQANSNWNGDSVQLMIANSNRTMQVALYNYALGGVEGALGVEVEAVRHEAGPAASPACNCATEVRVTRNSETKKTTYEIRLPAASVGLSSLTPQRRFGLGMAINDGDQATPGQKGWGGLGAHSIVFGKTPSETALVTLGTNFPAVDDLLFFSAVNPTIDSFSFRATDLGTSIVAPGTARLIIDGQLAPLTFVRTGDAVDFTHTRSPPFFPNSEHTYSIEVKDNVGRTATEQGSFVTPAYALLTAADRVTNPLDPGFIWGVHQNGRFTNNSISRALHQLAGLLGANLANPAATAPTFMLGQAGPTTNHPITFQFDEGGINTDLFGSPAGDIPDDTLMPGIPGLGASETTDGIAVEIIAFIDLPAGRHTFIVNSDDGFRTIAGNINDIFRGQIAGEFDGARTAADTAYDVRVLDAGVYAFRTVYYQGNANASIEWKLRKSDGTEVLLNDIANGGFAAYRRATGLPTGINMVSPLPGATGVPLDTAISASILEGLTTVDLNSVRLSLDGTQVAATPVRMGNLVSVKYQPPAFLTSAEHSASISFTAGGISRTQSWNFRIEAYATLTAAHKAVSVDTGKPGFIWRVFQNETFQHTSLAQTELALAGQLIAPGQTEPLPNLANPAQTGIAAGAGTTDGPLIRFEIPTVINLNQTGGGANGNFTPDDQMPGIPGINGGIDGIDAEIRTFVELPAGLVTMGVNSDDGFRTQAGYINRPSDGVLLGEFDGGRGAMDTIFKILVQEAGIYPLRTIWQEGGGGANIEWFTIKPDGTKVLLNDVFNDGLSTYSTGVAPNQLFLAIHLSGGQIEVTWTEPGAILQESTNLRTWNDLPAAISPYRPIVGARSFVFYRLKKP